MNVCNYCNKTFATKNYVKIHQRNNKKCLLIQNNEENKDKEENTQIKELQIQKEHFENKFIELENKYKELLLSKMDFECFYKNKTTHAEHLKEEIKELNDKLYDANALILTFRSNFIQQNAKIRKLEDEIQYYKNTNIKILY